MQRKPFVLYYSHLRRIKSNQESCPWFVDILEMRHDLLFFIENMKNFIILLIPLQFVLTFAGRKDNSA